MTCFWDNASSLPIGMTNNLESHWKREDQRVYNEKPKKYICIFKTERNICKLFIGVTGETTFWRTMPVGLC